MSPTTIVLKQILWNWQHVVHVHDVAVYYFQGRFSIHIALLAAKINACPVGICLLKVNNRNTTIRCEMCSKLTIKTPERHRSSVSVVNFEQVNAGWVAKIIHRRIYCKLKQT